MTATENNPVKLKVADKDDLVMLSGLLQDATVLIGDMAHDPDSNQFLMVAARYIAGSAEGTEGGRRRLMGVNFDGVKRVTRKGFSIKNREEALSLLALTPMKGGISLVFSGDATIRLECRGIKVYAADLNEGWHTTFTPSHD